MTSGTAEIRSLPSATTAGKERRDFLAALGVASLLPLIALSFGRVLHSPHVDQANFALAFAATVFHVALTPFFYFEPQFRHLRRTHVLRFFWVPACLCAVTSAVVFFVPNSLPSVLVFFFAWQLYHFQRQNVGVLAFVSSCLKVRRTTRLEHVAIELGAFAGVAGFLAIGGVPARAIADFSGLSFSTGLVAQVAAIGLALIAWGIRLRDEGWSWFGPWHILVTSFFAGTFVVPELRFAFGTYAYAHGLQYLLFMYLVSMSRGRALRRLSPLSLTLCGLAGSLLLSILANRARFAWTNDAVYGVYLGLVMSHFVVDSLVWRLSEPAQRDYARRAFAFVWD